MDIINNLVYTALHEVGTIPKLKVNYIVLPVALDPVPTPRARGGFHSYNMNVIEEFCAFDDADFVENSIQKHWADLILGRSYPSVGDTVISGEPPLPQFYSSFRNTSGKMLPPYHLIYAYLVENSRIAQIFERLIHLYMHDEKLNKATTNQNRLAFQWIMNTESLFFSNLSNTNYRNIKTQVRESPESTRRNAYFRMFGMDLAFGDLHTNAQVNYHKAEFNNQPFIILFEKLLTEIWQAYTNASNFSGANTTDMFVIVDTAQKIQEMLMSRRTTETDFTNYRYFNLSKEEYASVVMMSWLYEVISYDSPLIQFLRCNGGTPGERLINIGNKVGVAAHSKSEGLLDIAPLMNTLLRRIEMGDYNDQEDVELIIRSQVNPAVVGVEDHHRQALKELLQIINNWEKATGHKIKNPEANIKGIVRITPQQQRVNGNLLVPNQ